MIWFDIEILNYGAILCFGDNSFKNSYTQDTMCGIVALKTNLPFRVESKHLLQLYDGTFRDQCLKAMGKSESEWFLHFTLKAFIFIIHTKI